VTGALGLGSQVQGDEKEQQQENQGHWKPAQTPTGQTGQAQKQRRVEEVMQQVQRTKKGQ